MGRFIVSGFGFRVVHDVRDLGLEHASTAVCLKSSACTSPLVGRRDPLGVGLRSGWLPVLSHYVRTEQTPVYPTNCPAVLARYRAALWCVGPVASEISVTRIAELVPFPGLVSCWSAVFSDWLIQNDTGRRRYCFGYFQDPS